MSGIYDGNWTTPYSQDDILIAVFIGSVIVVSVILFCATVYFCCIKCRNASRSRRDIPFLTDAIQTGDIMRPPKYDDIHTCNNLSVVTNGHAGIAENFESTPYAPQGTVAP
ncbi:hypothetical protein RF11_10373 [Thelohanellus kitauei]|uniref:Uncharacterized protein n=1 Tax=Thelohanellus kitauei TaxID=669202 RepID=A0A0C2MZ98_THEKT|nr:hypothetical protein RF11_10373 [Thelohanellus kitauei]